MHKSCLAEKAVGHTGHGAKKWTPPRRRSPDHTLKLATAGHFDVGRSPWKDDPPDEPETIEVRCLGVRCHVTPNERLQ